LIPNVVVLLGIILVMIPVGFLAALVGIGGGVVVVPLLTVLFGVPIKEAVAVGIVTVVATGITSASRYLEQGLTNIRLGLFLNVTTTLGAIVGALTAVSFPSSALYLALSAVLFYVGCDQILTSKAEAERIKSEGFKSVREDSLASTLGLSNAYYDLAVNKEVVYKVTKSHLGLMASFMAGFFSGMLGIGGGVLKVPIMNQIMNVPLKAAVATSKFMIGITASTAALVYLRMGKVNTVLATATVLGISSGAFMGTKVMNRVGTEKLKAIFGSVLLVFGYLMLAKGVYQVMGVKLPGV